MRLLRILRTSRRALLAHRLRAALAAGAVAVGVAGVSVATAVGAGARQEVLAPIEAMGTRLLVVSAGPARRVPGRVLQPGSVTTLTLDDVRAVAELPWVAQAVPGLTRRVWVRHDNNALRTSVLGTLPGFFDVRKVALASGRAFSEAESRSSARVVVLGSRVHRNLGLPPEAEGLTVRLGRIPFEVVGVAASRGAGPDGADQDDQVYVPARTALRRIMNRDFLGTLFVSMHDDVHSEQRQTELRALLRGRHRLDARDRPDDFSILNQVKILETKRDATRSFDLAVVAAAALALLVGGTGILALMLLSVKERTVEIGLRLAVGARRRDVRLQFLVEALLLSTVGGAGGALLGSAGAWLVGAFTRWPVYLSAEPLAVAWLASAAAGLLFGVLPARRAARLEPVTALAAQ